MPRAEIAKFLLRGGAVFGGAGFPIVGELRFVVKHRSEQVRAFEMRRVQERAFEMRVREVRTFEICVGKYRAFEMCLC